MNRMSRAQQKEIDEQVSVIMEASSALEAAINDYNAAIEPVKGPLEEALGSYNEALSTLREIYEGIAQEAADHFSERSERWQEGEKGQQYQSWMDTLNDPGIENAELEVPEDLELPDTVPDWSSADFLPAIAPDEM